MLDLRDPRGGYVYIWKRGAFQWDDRAIARGRQPRHDSPNGDDAARLAHRLGARQFALADAVLHFVLRLEFMATAGDRVSTISRFGMADEFFTAPGQSADLCWTPAVQAGPGDPANLGPDAAAEVAISMGACASRAAIFDNYRWCRGSTRSFRSMSTCQCPPRHEGLLYGIICCTRRSPERRCSIRLAARRAPGRPGRPRPPARIVTNLRAVRQSVHQTRLHRERRRGDGCPVRLGERRTSTGWALPGRLSDDALAAMRERFEPPCCSW